MPLAIAEQVLAFFETHHVEREFIKRKRTEHDPRKGGEPRPEPGARAAGKMKHEPRCAR